MKITGLSSRIALFSRPLASFGLEGITTTRPGRWANQLSKACECCAATCAAAPDGPRITMGQRIWPPDM
jgi:hypothetical protein